MAIRYKIGRVTTPAGERRPYPKIVPGDTVAGEQFQERLARSAARGMPDAVAVLAAVRAELVAGLRDEQAVHVPGLGHFTLTIDGELDQDERLVAETACLKIHFRPERKLAGDVNAAQRYQFVGE
jgi:hypothetical protein